MTTWYEKRGRRYVPVAEHDRYDALTEGTYLLVVRPGSRSMCRLVKPASGEVEAAIHIAYGAMVDAMRKTNESISEPMGLMTEKEKQLARKALEAYRAVWGRERMVSYRGVSMHDVVDAGIQALKEHMHAQDDEQGVNRSTTSARKRDHAEEPASDDRRGA